MICCFVSEKDNAVEFHDAYETLHEIEEAEINMMSLMTSNATSMLPGNEADPEVREIRTRMAETNRRMAHVRTAAVSDMTMLYLKLADYRIVFDAFTLIVKCVIIAWLLQDQF